MYRIRIDKDRRDDLTSKHLGKYKDKLRKEIKGFLEGTAKFTFKRSVGSRVQRVLPISFLKNAVTL